jgi:hypothetical protein
VCLVLAYHLGATSAAAKVPATIQGAEFDQGTTLGSFAFVVDRTFYHGDVGGPGSTLTITRVTPVMPGISPVVAVRNTSPAAMLANGDVYARENNAWVLKGNVFAP